MEMISNELDLSSRTVYRRLKEENVTYNTLLNDIKKHLAQAYLKETTFTINKTPLTFWGFLRLAPSIEPLNAGLAPTPANSARRSKNVILLINRN